MAYEDFTVVIPTLNEGKNIGELLREVIRLYPGISIIVADDGSSDYTGKVVKKFGRKARFLDRKTRRVHGLTASVMEAASFVTTGYFVVIDGDLQHPPEKIKEIAGKLRQGNALVIGKRRKVAGKWPLHRKIISDGATILARIRLLQHVADPMSGFFGVRSDLFRLVAGRKGKKFEPEGYKVLFDLLKYMPKERIASVPYDFGLRKGGESKIRMKHILIMARALLS